MAAVVQTPIVECESTLTAKYQTTVPQVVREHLRLEKSDKIRYVVRSDGSVVVENASEQKRDPVINQFLDFLARDMGANPGNITPVARELVERAQDLVRDVDVDLDAPLGTDHE